MTKRYATVDFESFEVALSGVFIAVVLSIVFAMHRAPERVVETYQPPQAFSHIEKFYHALFVVHADGVITFNGVAVTAEEARHRAVGACVGDASTCEVVIRTDRAAPAGATVALLDSLYQFTPEIALVRDERG